MCIRLPASSATPTVGHAVPRDVSKGLIYALLATSLALLALVILAVVEPGSSQLAARPHATIESMLSAGPGAPGGSGTLWAGFATGLLVIVMIGLFLLVGVAPGATGLKRWIVGCTVVYGLVFGGLMLSYLEYLEGGPLRIFGGLPAPSAWMMYGVWLFPWVFILGYVVTFHTSYFPPESEERYRELLRSKKQG